MGNKTPQEGRVLTLVAPTGVEIVNRQQVAERLGLQPQQIYALVRSRANDPMPAHYAGRELRFVWAEVLNWFLNRKRKPRTVKHGRTPKKTKAA